MSVSHWEFLDVKRSTFKLTNVKMPVVMIVKDSVWVGTRSLYFAEFLQLNVQVDKVHGHLPSVHIFLSWFYLHVCSAFVQKWYRRSKSQKIKTSFTSDLFYLFTYYKVLPSGTQYHTQLSGFQAWSRFNFTFFNVSLLFDPGLRLNSTSVSIVPLARRNKTSLWYPTLTR